MTIHKSKLHRDWYVLDVTNHVIFRGTYDACQKFCEADHA